MRAEIILKKFCFKVCRGTPQAGGDEYTAFRTGKEGNDRMDYTEMLTDNRFAVIAALPRNDLALAEAALEGGAQAVKVHCNVWHRASGNTATLLLLMAYGWHSSQLFASDYAAIQVAQGVASTLGVVLGVPITSGICAALYRPLKR